MFFTVYIKNSATSVWFQVQVVNRRLEEICAECRCRGMAGTS